MNIRLKKPAKGPNPKSIKKKQLKILSNNDRSDKLPNRKTKKIRKRSNHVRTKQAKDLQGEQKEIEKE